MIKREISTKYKGSFFGILWSLLTPLLLLVVYTICFSYIFKTRWGVVGGEPQSSYSLILFVGLIVHAFFSEIFTRSPSLILGYAHIIKKTPFPIDILGWVTIGVALFQVFISTLVLLAINIFIYHQCSWTILMFPFILLPFSAFLLGICWFLSSIGVYVRDLGQFINLLMTVLMFLSPVFFPLSAIPEPYRTLALVNPLTLIIEESRNSLLYATLPNIKSLVIYFVMGLCIMKLGHYFLIRMKKGFCDVM
jgi:lipopolysaccharide transport system permease protein